MANIMLNPQPTPENTRKTVGVLLSYPANNEEVELLSGVVSVAETQGFDVVGIFGGQISDPSPRNDGFDLISAERFDGVLISSPVASGASSEQMNALRNKFSAVPVVAGAMEIDDVPEVYADSYGGMQSLVRHLVEEHHYQKIAYIGGIPGHPEADARYQAYCDVLAEAGIELDERLVAQGQFLVSFGREGMTALLEQELEIEAVVCATDDMAYGAYEVLRAHGMQVPTDIALVGFDDARIVQELPVPLTTVRQSFYQLGQQMMVILTGLMADQPVPERLLSQAQLVVRRSCGCELHRSVSEQLYSGPRDLTAMAIPEGVPENIWEAFLQDAVNPDAATNQFIPMLEGTLSDMFGPGADYQTWYDVIHTMRGAAFYAQMGGESLLEAMSLLDSARDLVVDLDLRRQEVERAAQRTRTEVLRLFDELLMGASDYMSMANAVQQYYGQLGFENCFIVQGDSNEVSRMVLRYSQGEATTPDIPIAPQSILPDSEWYSTQRHSWVVMPLVAQNRNIGYTVMSYLPDEGESFEHFSTQFAGATFRIQLLDDVAIAQRETEASLSQVLQVREVMDHISESATMDEVWQAAMNGMCDFTKAHSVITVLGTQEELIAHAEKPNPALPLYTAGSVAALSWTPKLTQSVTSGRVIHERNGDGIAHLVIPLIWSGEMIGVVSFQRAGELWPAEMLDSLGDIFDHTLVTYENRGLLGDLQQRASRLEVSAELSTALTSITEVRGLLDSVITLVQDRFAYGFVSIFLADDASRYAVMSAGKGSNAHELLSQDFRLEINGASTVGQCLTSSEVVHLPNVPPEAFISQRILTPGCRAVLAIPVMSRGKAMGVLLVEHTRPDAFAAQDITIMQTMANQMGNALENARSREQMEQNLRALETVTGEYTRAGWEGYLGQHQDETVAYRYSGVDVLPADAPNPEVVDAMSANEPVIRPLVDTQIGEGTAVGIPVRLRNQVLGALNVRFDQREVPEETVALIEQIADRLAVSLESARLLSETRRTAERERLVTEVTDRIRQPFAVQEVLEAAATEIRRLLDADFATVRLLPEGMLEGENLERALVTGNAVTCSPKGITETTSEPRAETLVALEEGRVVTTMQDTAWLSMPVRGTNQILGVLEVLKTPDTGAWTNEEITLLSTLATQLSAVIERARLYNETQRIAARQRTIAEVGAQMRSSLNLEAVLRTAAEEIRKALDLGEVVVQLGAVEDQQTVEAA